MFFLFLLKACLLQINKEKVRPGEALHPFSPHISPNRYVLEVMALEEHLVTTSTGIDRGLMRDMNFNVCLLWLSNEAKFGLTYGELDR